MAHPVPPSRDAGLLQAAGRDAGAVHAGQPQCLPARGRIVRRQAAALPGGAGGLQRHGVRTAFQSGADRCAAGRGHSRRHRGSAGRSAPLGCARQGLPLRHRRNQQRTARMGQATGWRDQRPPGAIAARGAVRPAARPAVAGAVRRAQSGPANHLVPAGRRHGRHRPGHDASRLPICCNCVPRSPRSARMPKAFQ